MCKVLSDIQTTTQNKHRYLFATETDERVDYKHTDVFVEIDANSWKKMTHTNTELRHHKQI
jgi:hypothetical protein